MLLPFIKEGLEGGEKAFHTVDPRRREDHLQRLASTGVNVSDIHEGGQLELRDWTDTHLLDGRFDPHKTLAVYGDIVKKAKDQGYPRVRFVTHMEWALEDLPGVDHLLEYEATASEILMRQDGPANPVICTYDLKRFGGELIIDVVRTHPMVIIGGMLQENPFFVPPDEFLRECRERLKSGRRNRSAASGYH